MSIIQKMKEEVIRRSDLFYSLTKGTKDEYHLYQEHVQYVYSYAVKIMEEYQDVDQEVVQLSALLHDIAMTDPKLDRACHNVEGARIAEELLRKENYPKDKIQLVKKCIFNHSSKMASFRTTKEEQILVDADALAHFDTIESLCFLASKVMGLNDQESLQFIQNKLTKDYQEISPNCRSYVEDQYQRVMHAKKITDLLT